MRFLVVLTILAMVLLPSCSAARDWADVVRDYAYSKVLITTDAGAQIMVLKWNPETKEWEEMQTSLPVGWYVLPPIPELLGLTGPTPIVEPSPVPGP